jgi:hypothetical protein
MKGLKTVRFGLAGTLAAALVALGAFLLVSQASAVSGTLMISSPSIAPGGQGTAELTANVPSPGLGAWTVDITYDPTKTTIVSCAPAQGGVCNPAFAATKVRITGASASGLMGATSLGTITLKAAGSAGNCTTTAPLTLTTNVFADATVGAPADITITGGPTPGTITCAAAVVPTATTGAAVATATKIVLVPSGTGPSSSDSNSSWLIVVLAGAGLAALAGYGALRVRSKSA